ncbi:DUF2996 domain-containing protein [Lyngbya sp. CCY1209]|uniref:DUF2996 domain-containing protein n=1 Tax=Lyngbya sp. CCY1209 TaxID=2886103 RepID=UPI002D201947|nr:DUF2996 domain-containing protein [Lyngbya sp. CCY1209]MEB3885711.1 DUF2996 domain-containing protein [Lyngbya sp. CCY1209]
MSEEEQKKPAAKAKKEKPPAVEDKPFPEFMEGHYVPALQTALQEQGIEDLQLQFVNGKFPPSLKIAEECPQVKGSWLGGRRQFTVYFPGEDIKGPKFFSWAADGTQPSSIEGFLGDERRINLDLLVFGVVQRLNAQKWLALN